MDAPWHYASTTDAALPEGARPAFGIDELPLEWCLRPGVKLDFRHLPDGHVVQAAEIEQAFERIGHTLQPLDIVLINTRTGSLFGQPGYLEAGVGIGREATLWMLERGVRVVGTDAWSWDARSALPAHASSSRRTPPLSGRATRLAATSVTGRSRNWRTWSHCLTKGSG